MAFMIKACTCKCKSNFQLKPQVYKTRLKTPFKRLKQKHNVKSSPNCDQLRLSVRPKLNARLKCKV